MFWAKAMMQFASSRKGIWPAWTAGAIAVLGLFLYLIQAVLYAHTTLSNLDEGAYLLKGILFASGKYQPFQTGMYTNKAPFAFFIPGAIQLLFGAGLRTGRYLAVFFGVMTVIGTWLTSRRLGGQWLAAAAVWVFALSPVLIKVYSIGVTQSSIACMFVWMLFFSMGSGRSIWQLTLAGFLAGLMVMDRQNMVLVLPILAVYAFWEHGWKAAGLLASSLFVVVITHWAYWPFSLRMWDWVPFLQLPSPVGYGGGGGEGIVQNISLLTRLNSTFQAFRFNFIPVVGAIASLLLWPKMNRWRSRADFRMGLLLLSLFWSMFLMHALASIGRDYCVFCFTYYIAFFNVTGILLLVLLAGSWNRQPSPLTQALLIVIQFIILTGMGFSAFEDIGPAILELPAPRMRELRILPGFVTWGDILSGRFHLGNALTLQLGSALFGFAVCGLSILIGYIIWRRMSHDRIKFGAFFSAGILGLGLVFSPLLHGSAGARDCSSDVILANEQIGSYLRRTIPRGSLVYWDGGLSTAPLLYLPGVDIFPAQINDQYSYRTSSNTAEVNAYGFWNDEMNAEWKSTADFFIIENGHFPAWKEFLSPEKFDEFERSPVGTSCSVESQLRVFHRK